MSIDPTATPQTKTTKLPEVRQPLAPFTLSALMGSTADVANGRVFWHAGCDPSYHVTDIATGTTKTFAIDFAAIGVQDIGRGLCLAEWVYDSKRNVAIALAGRANTTWGKSTVDFAITLDDSGTAKMLFDLRGRVDPNFMFLFQMETIASLDPDTDEIVAPLFKPQSSEDRMVLDIATGAVTFIGPPGAKEHAFFDLSTRRHTYFDCGLPGWTSGTNDPSAPRVVIGSELAARGITNACTQGYVGGGYDPVGHRDYLLLRTAVITDPKQTFLLGSVDLDANRWLGFIETDATYGALGFGAVGDGSVFLSTEYLPAR
jgi:hypothetical protein